MSRDISGSGSKPAIEFVCSLILVLQNVQFEFRQGLRHYCLLRLGHLRSLGHPKK